MCLKKRVVLISMAAPRLKFKDGIFMPERLIILGTVTEKFTYKIWILLILTRYVRYETFGSV